MSRAISAQYIKYMKESRIKRIEQCCEEVKQAVRQFHKKITERHGSYLAVL